MKNCEDFKLEIAENPSRDDIDAHVSGCSSCRTYLEDMRALDRKIAAAMSIAVPEVRIPELGDIDDSAVIQLSRRRLTLPAWLAVAATVTVAALIGFRMLGSGLDYPALADEIIAHLEHEPYALRVTDRAVSDERLARVVPASIAQVDHSAGLITYAQSCIINGNTVPHLVIQGERGPITILLMPEQAIDRAQPIDGDYINGVILPVGSGSIAIVGEKNEDLERVQNSVIKSLTWST